MGTLLPSFLRILRSTRIPLLPYSSITPINNWSLRIFSAILQRFPDTKTMAIEAVKIPQNVYVEDRIIGPVTLKHLLILGIGAGISYVFYAMTTQAGYTEIPYQVVSWSPLMIAAAFAFVRVNDLSLFNIILLMIESSHKPNVRYWSPHPGLSINVITRQTVQELEKAQSKASDTASKLAEMTRQLEKRQEELNRMAAHEEQKPEALEAVKTHMQDIIAPEQSVIEKDELQEVIVRGSSLPVAKGKVKASALDPALSLDTISKDIPAFQEFAATQY